MSRLGVGFPVLLGCFLAWALLGWVPPAWPDAGVEWLHPDFVARQYTVEDGLPVNATTSVRLGPDGFLWITTFDGLARFDGERFVVYRRADHPELPSNRLMGMGLDAEGALWLETVNGRVARWKNGRIERLEAVAGSELGPVLSRRLDADRRLWLGTAAGIFRLERDGLRRICALPPGIRGYHLVPRPPAAAVLGTGSHGLLACDARGVRTLLSPPSVRGGVVTIVEHRGSLWFVDSGGLHRLDGGDLTTIDVPGVRRDHVRRGADLRENRGTLWLRTGLDVFRIEAARAVAAVRAPGAGYPTARFVQADAQGRTWLASGNTLYRDGEPVATVGDILRNFEVAADGTVWLATNGEGLIRIRRRIGQVFADRPELAGASLYAVAPSPTRPGRVWLGGRERGLMALEGDRAVTVPTPGFVAPLWTILEDSSGRLWLGGMTLCRLDRGGERCDDAHLPAELTGPGPVVNVRMLMEDSAGAIWIGSKPGLYRVVGDAVERIEAAPAAIVRVGLERRDGSIWFGTNGAGVWVWRQGRLRPLGGKLESRLIRSLYEDADGVVWIGTEDQGLLRVETDPSQEIVDQRRFGPDEGLWDDVIHKVVEDARGRLWMNSNRGIFWIERALLNAYEAGESEPLPVVGYTEEDGLLDREGNGGSHSAGMVDARGRIWFPGQGGLVRIDPATVERRAAAPRVVIEAATAGGVRSIRPARLELPAARRDLGIRYAAPVFRHPERSRFRYRLLGYDDHWIDAGRRVEALYTKLPAGSYRFEVAAANAFGQWSRQAASLEVIALPRYYERGWFRGLIVLAVLALATLAYRRRVAHLRARSARLEALVDERTQKLREEQSTTEEALAQVALQARKLRELDSAKSRFFTNLSHELRTPLTLILGPAEQALASVSGADSRPVRQHLRSIRGNAERLLELVQQILALSRLEAGYQELETRGGDLAAFCRQVLTRFAPMAAQKHVDLRGPPPTMRCVCAFDHDAVDKILGNLLSNAVRHAPTGTAVGVSLRRVTGGVVVRVSDQGPGIPPERLDRVFDRFYTASQAGSGSGIGLALARELAHLHGGDLSVESQPGRGSIFKLVLPLEVDDWHADPEVEDAEVAFTPAAPARPAGLEGDRTTVLVVEDEPEVGRFIEGCLEARYRVLSAEDGNAGLALARRELPDLIVSDIMMPHLDGTAMVRALAADPVTTAIPVIFLTAKSAQAHEIEGLAAGAVDYLTKPFAPEILLARVERMLGFARRLREQLRMELAAETEEGTARPRESPVERIERVIRRHLAEPELDVDKLAREANTSRSSLKRHLADAGLPPPSLLIRQRRLEQAARLLARGRGSVTEVAYATGFQALSNFTKRFRERFGQSPSEYTATHHREQPADRRSEGS